MNPPPVIATERQTHCPVCGSDGVVAYRDLQDALYGAPGKWSFSRCSRDGCATLWLDPRPTPSEIGKAYHRYYTHSEAGRASMRAWLVHRLALANATRRFGYESPHLARPLATVLGALSALYPGLRPHLDLLARYLPASKMGAGRLLDVGCGDGEAMTILRDLGWSVVGLDADERAVVAARSRGLEVLHGTLATSDLAEASFDAVVSSHVIEHVHDPLAFLVASRRLLREGGHLVAVTPNVCARSHIRHAAHWRGLEPPRHLSLFASAGLERLASTAGLREIEITTTARAVALSEIASSVIRDRGCFEEGRWPGFRIWASAQVEQWRSQARQRAHPDTGNELLLTAMR